MTALHITTQTIARNIAEQFRKLYNETGYASYYKLAMFDMNECKYIVFADMGMGYAPLVAIHFTERD